MEHKVINSVVVNYIKQHLSPTESERTMISKKYDELKNFLDGKTFINGSYARFTSTTPVNDLDVFYVLSENDYKKYKDLLLENRAFNVDDIINDLAKYLSKKYPSTVIIKPQPHSVGVFFGTEDDFSIDVVPAIPGENNLFWVPESSHLSTHNRRVLYESVLGKISWIKSDPKGYIEDATNLDVSTGGNFRKTAKFIRKWRRGCKNISKNFSLKSFHSELIVNKICKSNSSQTPLEYIESFYSLLDIHLKKAQVPDRADNSRFVDEYVNSLDEAQRNLILEFKDDAKKYLHNIYNSDSEAEIIKNIELLLYISNKKNPDKSISTKETISAAYSKPYIN